MRCPVEGCPCDERQWKRKAHPDCTCGQPLLISVPAGEHVHPCPVHPDVVIKGPEITL